MHSSAISLRLARVYAPPLRGGSTPSFLLGWLPSGCLPITLLFLNPFLELTMPYTTPENLAASEYDLDEESNGPFWNEASFYDCVSAPIEY